MLTPTVVGPPKARPAAVTAALVERLGLVGDVLFTPLRQGDFYHKGEVLSMLPPTAGDSMLASSELPAGSQPQHVPLAWQLCSASGSSSLQPLPSDLPACL